jgi:hypothetical protein
VGLRVAALSAKAGATLLDARGTLPHGLTYVSLD